MQAMILAAGFGTRLQPYTNLRPKPLFPVMNKPLLMVLLDLLRENKWQNIVVNCHHLAEQMQVMLEGRADVNVQYEQKILGTGGSLRQALPFFSDKPILVMNGDIYHSVDIGAVYRHHLQSGNSVTMAMHEYPRFNTVWTDQSRVVSFRPEMISGLSRLAFTGIHVLNPEIVEMIPVGRFFHIIDLYQTLAQDRRQVGIFRVDGSYWRDIGTPQDYLQLHQDLLCDSGENQRLKKDVKTCWQVHEQAHLPKNVTLVDWGCIGAGVTIGSGVKLARCVVWDGAKIIAGAEYADCIVTGVS